MLETRQISVTYSGTQVLWDVSTTFADGEVVGVIGPNGSGKSTLFKAIAGFVRPSSGTVLLDGADITGEPAHRLVDRSLVMVLERRRLFGRMSVRENLELGAYRPKARAAFHESLEWVLDLLPVVARTINQTAGMMSGGEQQMVAIARGLMSRPRILLLDEPFLGLTPMMVDQISDLILRLKGLGMTVIFNEQNVERSFTLADRGYVLESGRLVVGGAAAELLSSALIRETYLGA